MKTSPDRNLGSEPQRPLEGTTGAPQLNSGETRADVRNVLALNQDGAVHPDAGTVARFLDAPSVVTDKLRAMVTMLAAGALLPGCDGSTLLCVLCSSAAFAALTGAVGYGLYNRFFETRNLGAAEYGVFVRAGVLGDLASRFNRDGDVLFEKEHPVTYFKPWRRYEGGFQDTVVNYPIPADKSIDALANGQSDYSRLLEATDAVKHKFTWSVQAEIIPEKVKLFYTKFKKKLDYDAQNTNVFDATQKALSDVVARITFDNVADANKKRARFNAEAQASPVLTDFANTFGLKLTIILGDIEAPKTVSDKAELNAAKDLDISISAKDVQIKENQGKGEAALQVGRSAAARAAGAVQTEVYKERQIALGLNPREALAAIGLEALRDTGAKVLDIFGGRSSGQSGGPSDDGSTTSKK